MKIFIRKCPVCNKDIEYKNEFNLRRSKQYNRPCQSCAGKSRVQRYGCGDNFKQYTIKGACAGEKNPFYGKTHSEATKEKIRNRDKSFFKTKEYKDKVSKQCKGSGNPMYGKTYYQVWVEKYGKEKADELQLAKNKKTSEQCKGENNPMYGRPTPQGSGNGWSGWWSGWYKGWFFRSLKELSYVVGVLEASNDTWVSAETAGIKIPYTNWNGNTRTYTPDFLVNSILLIEVKPARLKSSITVRIKQEAAEKFCEGCGWQYVLIDPPLLSKDEIKQLHDDKLLIFTKRYEQLYQNNYISK